MLMDLKWLGIQSKSSLSEKVVASLGGFLSLVILGSTSYLVLGIQGAIAIVPSMGAAAVLLFASPHAPLSQPWALFFGNTISAFIGVTCALLSSNLILGAGLAVGLSILAMYFTRSVHPPGGATGLAAVIGGPAIENLGYWYILFPVLLNCSVIFLFAMIFNNMFGWRRYPATAYKYRRIILPKNEYTHLSDHYLNKGMQEIGGVIDISPNQLRKIYDSAMKHRDNDIVNKVHIELGGVYSNDQMGAQWEVRKVVDYGHHPEPNKELVIYKVLEGPGKGSTGSCSRVEFSFWAFQRIQPVYEDN